ncbi:fumarylacetoacetate hydrolase family protein [Antrihabitans stalactiti]|uniref:fumarylacetoacetase n=1 Tax=Antrihabitans stalactiti TaxID=2584121 RepID=A0A848KMW1_9NOCA|nr:fumarylacetoacetate hydrolase family protein [Antrihabitans stalactiti]NMN99216.1 fumarylacetoacetase [Antrihabitans stalactiti]
MGRNTFGPQTLPCGIAEIAGRTGVVSRISDQVIDLMPIAAQRAPELVALLNHSSLNPLLSAGRSVWDALRGHLTEWVGDMAQLTPHLHPLASVKMLLPFAVGDYVDFYSSRQHAENVGRIFRPGQPMLPPNWLHMPIGYHGRSGTVVVSGTPVRRPSGQFRSGAGEPPVFGPCARLDFEAEVGFVIGADSAIGQPISTQEFADHVFGVVLVNDWSARDIQAWEYVPLGPFLGKSFATSISAWVTPLAALDNAWTSPPDREVEVLPYLGDGAGLNVTLEVAVNGVVISNPSLRDMYWTPAQQLAHMTINGASTRAGDLFASGTVSGPEPSQWGSLLELTWNGSNGSYLADDDEVTITATAPGPNGTTIDLGEVSGVVTS